MNKVLPQDEGFHEDARMEWWYIAALLNASDSDKLSFVSSFFSYSERRGDRPGHLLTYALMRYPNKGTTTGSLIDKQLRDTAFSNLRRSVEEGTANEYAKAYHDSMRLCDAPNPHKVVEESKFSTSGLSVRFGANRLEKTPEGNYHISVEDKDFTLELDATPSKPTTLNGDNGVIDFDLFKMKSHSYTKTTISGRLSDGGHQREVTGQGWIDHNWGDWPTYRDALFKHDTKRSKEVSWQWFGLQLDDDTEINAYIPKGAIAGSDPIITYTPRTGTPKSLKRMEVRPHGVWQSLRTLNIYPVGWTLEVPDLTLKVEVEPLAFAEMPVFGPVAGVLEAANSIHGQIKGRSVQGTCWAETLGDAFDYGNFWKGQKECVNTEIQQIIPRQASDEWLTRVAGAPMWTRSLEAHNETLIKPVWDLMDRGGKRWRPIWMFTCCEAVGGDPERFRNLMPIPELIHTGSLIVDDIEDGSLERRGGVSLHARYGVPIALNAGNTLYYLPLMLIEENKALTLKQRYLLYRLVAEAGRRAHLGQASDIFMSSNHVDLEAFLRDPIKAKNVTLQTCSDKTGVQARTLGEMGSVIGGGSDAQVKALGDYSEVVGMTFQMINDISNIENEGTGKWGEDIAQGKMGIVALEAISAANPPESQRLVEILKQRSTEKQLIQEAITIIKQSGAVEAIKRQAESLLDEKWGSLAPLLEESDAKVMLRAGPKWLLRGDVESEL